MIVQVVVLFEGLRTKALRLADKVVAFLDRKCRYTNACEGDMIGAVVPSLLGTRVGLDRKAHAFGGRLDDRPGRGPLSAIDHNVASTAEGDEAIIVDGYRSLARRDLRMRRIIFRAAPLALFGGHRQKQCRPARLFRLR